MQFNRIPAGSLVLVTGGTGLTGSAISELLLKKAFRVRCVTRNAAKAGQLLQHFTELYGKQSFEVAEVVDQAAPGAYDSLLDGVAGVIHVATDLALLSDDYSFEKVIGPVVSMTVNLMKEAAKTPSVKSFVLTSSRATAYSPEYGKDIEVPLDTFLDPIVEYARNATAANPARNGLVYAASKLTAERAAWDFWREQKPKFAFNAILPDMILGPVSNPTPGFYLTHTLVNGIFLGDSNNLGIAVMQPAALIVDVRDVAAIHVAALLSDTTNGERLWAATHQFHVNDLLAIWRKAYPDRTILPDFDFGVSPKITLDTSKSAELVRALEGRDWYSLEETVLANVAKVAASS